MSYRILNLIGFLMLALILGCSSNSSNPVSAFEPEVINNADSFQFQITNGSNITTTLQYNWTNTGTQATINHSTTTTSGTASVVLLDADDTQVYSGTLSASANEASSVGTVGVWTVRVIMIEYSGTVNFRVEKL